MVRGKRRALRGAIALCCVIVLGSLGVLPTSSVAAATTYTVNAPTDTGAGVGTTGDLRYAINQVNAGSGGDTITITTTGTIVLGSALPALAKNVTITGPGAASLVIDGNNGVTPFTVNGGVTASVNGVTIQNGYAYPSVGGGIVNNGTLTLTNSALLGNNGLEGGGAIDNTGALSIADTTFEKNRGGTDLGAPFVYRGGAIKSTGSLVITNSTFFGNLAGGGSVSHETGSGGAIDTSGTATITNSTFFDNGAAGAYNGGAVGGAIANSGTLTVTNSTFATNRSGLNATGGGGIYNLGGTVNLTNTIVANSAGGDLVSALGGFIGYNNLIDDAMTAGGFTDGVQGNIVGHPALLTVLANNGGPTQTIAPLATSPAVDHGAAVGQGPFDNTVPATDQRGIARPQGSAVDIGAYEFTPPNALPAPRPAGSPAAGGPSPLPSPRTGSGGSGTTSQPAVTPAPLPVSRPSSSISGAANGLAPNPAPSGR